MSSPEKKDAPPRLFPVVGIGSSAGGLEALTQVFRALPSDTGMAFLVVQHLDPNHESILTELLAKATSMPVAEASEGMAVEPDRVYVIPPGKDMRFEAGRIRLIPRQSPHLPVDSLFRSIAEAHLDGAVGVVLSGTGSDGAAGVADIHAQGGITIAQDPAGAKFDGMPRSAIATGCVSAALPTEGIAEELARISRLPGRIGTSKPDPREKTDDISPVLGLLRDKKGVDFSSYKNGTIMRRIVRRMVMGRMHRFSDYAGRLREDPAEVDRLYDDVLISVTRFFRDEEEFRVLKEQVLPELLKDRAAGVPIRIWVAGCATGEEVYTFAICVAEFLEERQTGVPVQIFGTDVSEHALSKARAGLYPEAIEKDVSPERLRRFFRRSDGHYQVSKSLREACVFARHDLLNDPPFSKMDVISCRNVLIYLNPSRQKKLLPLFHFSLNPRGWLVLGTSETVGASPLFTPLSRSHRIFAKNASVARPKVDFPTGVVPSLGVVDAPASVKAAPDAGRLSVQVDRALIHRYAPAGAVVNERSEVVQFRGDTSPYLAHAAGEPSFKLLRLVRDGLRPYVDELLTRARSTGASARKAGVPMERDGQVRDLVLEAIPVPALPGEQRLWILTFEEASSVPREGAAAGADADGSGQEPPSVQEHLERLIDEKEIVNQDLQSAHEEVLSTNEELQSINEEMQTAKEELQSANEELTTMNGELHHVNEQSLQLIADLNNLLESVDIPVVIVDAELRVRRFTTQAQEAFNLIGGDVGRPIGHLKPRLNVVDLEKTISSAVSSGSIQEQFLQDPEGRWRCLRVRPYKTAEGKVEGAVITVLDVDDLKRNEIQVSAARDSAEDILNTLREPFLVLNGELKVLRANPSFYRTFGLSPADMEGRPLHEAGQGQWSAPEIRLMLRGVAAGQGPVQDFELRHGQEDGLKFMLLNASKIMREGKEDLILLAGEDQTERRQVEERVRAFNAELELRVRKRTAQLTAANEELESFSYSVSHDLRTPLRGIDGFSRILLKRYGDKMDEEGRAFFHRIRAASQRMSLLINGLLSLSRLARRPIRRDRVDLSAMAESLAGDLQKRQPERRVRFTIPPGIVAFGDQDLIRAALDNLIGNAWKFTGKRPEAEIELGRMEQEGETVYFIRDNGAGFDPAYAGKMFEAFQRLHTFEEFPGTGIGLATVQRVIRRHGGRIWAEGGVGKGATFFFTFMRSGELFSEETVSRR